MSNLKINNFVSLWKSWD